MTKLQTHPFEHPGLLIVINIAKQLVQVRADLLGVFPAYWCSTEGKCYIANNLSQLHASCPGETDHVGFIQYMRFGYTIGQRTIYKNIQRLRPGELITFDLKSGTVRSEDCSDLWSLTLEIDQRATIDQACELLTETCRSMECTMLMMSAGWDSRTLVAGAISAGVADSMYLYHHGDLASRESAIVRSLSKALHIPLVTQQIDLSCFDVSFLTEQFCKYESVLFPHWHFAGTRAIADDLSITSVSAGIFGEILGGHYGPTMNLQGLSKAVATLGYILDIPQVSRLLMESPSDSLFSAMEFFRQRPYTCPWFLNNDYWEDRFFGINEYVNKDIAKELTRYHARGVDAVEAKIEAFITEHRGSQYIADQLRSAAGNNLPMVAPFANRSLVQFAAAVPYRFKAHSMFNRQIIDRLQPDLLRYPTAAILVPARMPIAVQELSRAIRKLAELSRWRLHSFTKGRVQPPKYGWPNYQFIQNSTIISEIVESLKSPIWDKQTLRTAANKNQYKSFHPLMDMLLKMKTLDLFGVG